MKTWHKNKNSKFCFGGIKRYLDNLLVAERYLDKLAKYLPFLQITLQIFGLIKKPKIHWEKSQNSLHLN